MPVTICAARGLSASGVDSMVAQGEGHGFHKPENQAELYRRVDAFISANTDGP